MPTVNLFRFQYTTTSPHRPGQTFNSAALFSSRAWFERCLQSWSRLGYSYTESHEDAKANAGAVPTKLVASRESFLTDTQPAYIESRVGFEGSSDGACHAMSEEAAARWAAAYKVSVDDLSHRNVTRFAA